MTFNDFKSQLYKILPQGSVFPKQEDESELDGLLETIAKALSRANDESQRVMNDTFPDQVGDFLNEWWEEMELDQLGLPAMTDQQRRDLIMAYLNLSPYANKEFFVSIAAAAGYQIYIENNGDNPAIDPWEFTVYSPFSTIRYFRTGISRAGDALVSTGNDALETLIRFFKPAHTKVSFDTIPNGNLWSVDNVGTYTTIDNNGTFATIQ